jgi:hypothetical protein
MKKAKYEEALAVANKCVEVAPDHWGGKLFSCFN